MLRVEHHLVPGQSNEVALGGLIYIPRGIDVIGHYAVTFAFQFSNTEQEKWMKRLSLKIVPSCLSSRNVSQIKYIQLRVVIYL